MRQRAVPIPVLRKVTVEQIDRSHRVSAAADVVPPGAQMNCPALDRDGGPLRQLLEKILSDPLYGIFRLPAAVGCLVEVTFAVQ